MERAVPRRPGPALARLAPTARRLALGAAARRRGGTIEVTDAAGAHRLGEGGPLVRARVHDDRAYACLLGSGSVGLGRSYVAGWWDCDDLTTLVQVLFRWTSGLRGPLDALARATAPLLDLPARWAVPGRADDAHNVRAHYDLSNEFFGLMLDETMTYSCAMFEGPGASLADAQRAKIDRLCTKLALRPEDHVVEIGSGWGGLCHPRRRPLRLPGDHDHYFRGAARLCRRTGGAGGPFSPGERTWGGLAGPAGHGEQ